MSVDNLSNSLNSIKVHEMVGKKKCRIISTKITKKMMEIFQKEGYVLNYSEKEEEGKKYLEIALDGRINNCGVIKPNFPVKKSEWSKFEQRFIPAIGVGVMIVSTPSGIMTNIEAQKLKIGGRLMAYVY
ncbi:MAG: 30S ribosomal protein S8 [Candidatus Micrarchaeia archaeon]